MLAEKTGFSEGDLELVWTALRDRYDTDRSAARGQMTAQQLIAFKHENPLGNSPAHKLLDRITVHRIHDGVSVPIGDTRSQKWPPARAFTDYGIKVNESNLPPGHHDRSQVLTDTVKDALPPPPRGFVISAG